MPSRKHRKPPNAGVGLQSSASSTPGGAAQGSGSIANSTPPLLSNSTPLLPSNQAHSTPGGSSSVKAHNPRPNSISSAAHGAHAAHQRSAHDAARKDHVASQGSIQAHVLPAAADSIRPQAGSQKKQQQSQRGDAGCDAAGSLSEPLSPSKNVTRQQGLHHHQRTDTVTHGALDAAAASSTHRDHTLVQPAPSRQWQRRRSAFSLQEYYVDVAHGCVCLADPSKRADSREQNTQPSAAAASVDAAATISASTQQHQQHQQHAEQAGSAPGQQAHARATGTSPHDAEAAWPPHDAEPEWNAHESTLTFNLRRHHQHDYHHYDRPSRCLEPITISSPCATFTSHAGVDLNTFSVMAGGCLTDVAASHFTIQHAAAAMQRGEIFILHSGGSTAVMNVSAQQHLHSMIAVFSYKYVAGCIKRDAFRVFELARA